MQFLGMLSAQILAWCMRKAPRVMVTGAGTILGWIWCRIIPVRRGVAREHMRMALGRDDAATQQLLTQMYRHYAVSILELFRHGTSSGEPFLPEVEGFEHLEAAMENGRGAILCTAHLGNWELLIRYGASLPWRLTVVTRVMTSNFFNAMWRTLRTGSAQYVTEGTHPRTLVRRLANNELVGFVLDQYAPERTAHVSQFFGRKAASSTGLAKLAAVSGAAVVPVFIRRLEDGSHTVVFERAIQVDDATRRETVERMTEACLTRIEMAIRASPEQWLWLHRRWKVEQP